MKVSLVGMVNSRWRGRGGEKEERKERKKRGALLDLRWITVSFSVLNPEPCKEVAPVGA